MNVLIPFVLYPGNSCFKFYNKLLLRPITSRKLGLESPYLLQLPMSSQQGLRLSFVKGKENSMGSNIIPARDFVCIPASAPLPWPGILAWWTTTSSTMRLPIQIDVTNNGGSAGSVFDLCVLRALWKRKSVWPDGGPASLKGSFLRVWAKQHSWLDRPELKSFYMLLIPMCVCLAFTVVSPTVALSFPMKSLPVQMNTHTSSTSLNLKIL